MKHEDCNTTADPSGYYRVAHFGPEAAPYRWGIDSTDTGSEPEFRTRRDTEKRIRQLVNEYQQ